MKKSIIILSLILFLLFVLRFFSRDDSGATIGKPLSDTTSDGRELFALEAQQAGIQDFVSGGIYLVLSGKNTKEFRFVRYENGIPIFVNAQGQEESFSNHVLLSVSSDVYMEEVEKFVKEDKSVLEYEMLSLVRTVNVSFESPYTAYLKHLEYAEQNLFTSVGLDFTVSTMHNEDIGI